jgi:hypothetical protein
LSTKRRWVIFRFRDISIKWKSMCYFSSAMDLMSAYAIRKKRSTDKGNHCFNPLSTWKKDEVEPLISTTKETNVICHITQLMKGTSNTKWVRSNQM